MLTVMTLNLNYYVDKHGGWPQRRALIHEAIASVSPDIVAFQAVRRELAIGGGVDQATQLARVLEGYDQVFYEPADERTDGTTQGMAIISRIPIKARAVQGLGRRPGIEDDNPRVVQHAVFQLSEGSFHLFNSHFSWVEEQVRDNLDETLPLITGSNEMKLVVGDMNTEPDSPLLDQFRQADFTDAWAELRPDEPGYTFEADKPEKRIDYAWVNALLKPHLRDIKVVSNNRDHEGVRMSDHFGLVVGLDLHYE